MIGTFTAWYLNEEEFKAALELNKLFKPLYIPHLQVEILRHYTEQNFVGRLINERKYLAAIDGRTNTIISDYESRKRSALTFDGIRFFKITGILDDTDTLHFNFQYIDTPTFTEKNTAFMIMPFGSESLNRFYKEHIRNFLSASELGIEVRRSDDFTGTDVIVDTIKDQIRKAEFIICDVTTCNKNVFSELGFADGIRKDIIMLLEHDKPHEFFDASHVRRIQYDYGRPEEFQRLLIDTLLSIRRHRG